MIKKKMLTTFTALAMTLAMSFAAFAGTWEGNDESGYRYKNDDGTYVTSAYTPDGYYIGADGLWNGGPNDVTGMYPCTGTRLIKSVSAVLGEDNIYHIVANVYDSAFYTEDALRGYNAGDSIVMFGQAPDGTDLTATVTKVQKSNKITVKGNTTDYGNDGTETMVTYQNNKTSAKTSTQSGAVTVEATDSAGNTYQLKKNITYKIAPDGTKSNIYRLAASNINLTLTTYRLLDKLTAHGDVTIESLVTNPDKFYIVNIANFTDIDKIGDTVFNY